MLAQLDEFQAKFIKERKNLRFSLNAATARIKELERDLAQSQTTNDTLTDMIGKLQSKLEEYMKEIDSPSSPFVTNTQEISSSNEVIERQLHSTDSANSQNVNSIRRLSAGEDETINHTNDDTAVDNRDVGIPKENQHQQLETVSESVPNTEIVTGTDGISSYFSNFYIDPQTINSDENLVISTIPPTMRMVLSSYERFDKRYLVFVTEEASSGSKDCHFLSIDDLLALPENADLVQQLKNGQSTSPDGEQNLSLFAVLGQLIARMSPAIEKSVDEDAQQQTQDNQNQIKTEEKPVVNKRYVIFSCVFCFRFRICICINARYFDFLHYLVRYILYAYLYQRSGYLKWIFPYHLPSRSIPIVDKIQLHSYNSTIILLPFVVRTA